MCGKPCEFSTQLVLNTLLAVKLQKNEQYIPIENDQNFRLGRFGRIDMVPFVDLDSYLFCMFVGRSGRVKEGGELDGDSARKSLNKASALVYEGKSLDLQSHLTRRNFKSCKNRFSTVGTDRVSEVFN